MIQIKKILKRFTFVRKILEEIKRKQIITLKKSGSLLNILNSKKRKHWKQRIELLLESSDNNRIRHVPEAGKFNKDNNLVMHNGLVIDPFSYCGLPMLEALFRNKGVHEPQEEYVFQEVLKEIPNHSTMIELGSYWSFYSMWFNQKIKNAHNYMIEPEHIDSGKKNFSLNNMKGDFKQAYISDCSEKNKVENNTPTICIDGFIEEKKIKFVDILHSDIQGFEFLMLKGAKKNLNEKNIGYFFISTHSQDLHYKCMDYMKSKEYILVCSADINESYSYDGLLVFKNPNYNGLERISISKRELK